MIDKLSELDKKIEDYNNKYLALRKERRQLSRQWNDFQVAAQKQQFKVEAPINVSN